MKPMIEPGHTRPLTPLALIALLLAPIAIVGSLLLVTADIHVPIQGDGSTADSFCGSAYDVTFLKQNGYMGGEYPPNQDKIDSACAKKSDRYAYSGVGVGLMVPFAMAFVFVSVRRRRSTNERGHRSALDV